tara:strand:- start:795 stop:923 length:129 start_codon:yes stop_codon:yes gene_type:complete
MIILSITLIFLKKRNKNPGKNHACAIVSMPSKAIGKFKSIYL